MFIPRLWGFLLNFLIEMEIIPYHRIWYLWRGHGVYVVDSSFTNANRRQFG